jgi:hypothetical protein
MERTRLELHYSIVKDLLPYFRRRKDTQNSTLNLAVRLQTVLSAQLRAAQSTNRFGVTTLVARAAAPVVSARKFLKSDCRRAWWRRGGSNP